MKRVRFMHLLVFFDLPVDTSAHRRSYQQFHTFLIKDGYLMMQESVYSKLVINDRSTAAAIARINKHRPTTGLIQILKVTEKQFASIIDLNHTALEHPEIDDTEGLTIL